MGVSTQQLVSQDQLWKAYALAHVNPVTQKGSHLMRMLHMPFLIAGTTTVPLSLPRTSACSQRGGACCGAPPSAAASGGGQGPSGIHLRAHHAHQGAHAPAHGGEAHADPYPGVLP